MLISELFVRVRGDTSDLTRKMSSAEKSIQRFGQTAGKWLGVGLGIGLIGVIKNSIEAQNSLAQLEARIKSTGGAAGRSVEQLQAQASALQKITTFSDEAVQGAQSLLLTFKQIRGAEFDRATKATLDLATAMGTDLRSAALQLGKALEDPTRGMTALRRSGVSFSKEQEAVIKKLVETGKVAEAQNLILEEMETQFGGAAEAARNTLGGALLGLKNAFGDVLEISGDASSGVVGAINRMAEAMPKLRRQFDIGFSAAGEQLAMFKRDFVFVGTVVTTTIALMIEAFGRMVRTFSLRLWGQGIIDEAQRIRREALGALRDAQQDVRNAGRFRLPATESERTGIAQEMADRGAGTAGTLSTPGSDQAAQKAARDALWRDLSNQFKAAFDNSESVMRAWSTGVADAMEQASNRIAIEAGKVETAIDRMLNPRTPTRSVFEKRPDHFGGSAAIINEAVTAGLPGGDRGTPGRLDNIRNGLDKVKDEIFTQTNILHAAMIALGDKILIGGSGAGSRAGGGIGSLLGGAVGTVFGGPIGGAFATIAGTMLGSAIGGLFDKPKKAADDFTTALNRATQTLGNIPAGFRVEAYRFAASPVMPNPRGGSAPIVFNGPVEFNGVTDLDGLRREVRREATAGGLGLGFA